VKLRWGIRASCGAHVMVVVRATNDMALNRRVGFGIAGELLDICLLSLSLYSNHVPNIAPEKILYILAIISRKLVPVNFEVFLEKRVLPSLGAARIQTAGIQHLYYLDFKSFKCEQESSNW